MQRRRFNRRELLRTTATGTALLALAPVVDACSRLAGGGNSATSGTVEFMAHFTPLGKGPRHDASKKIWSNFQQKYPNITIKWQETAWPTIGEKFMAAWSANTSPDISLFSPANIGPVYELGALTDLQPYLQKWPSSDQQDFPKAWWQVGTYGKEKIICPLLLFGNMLTYRKSAFAKVEVDPSTLKTWDGWVAALQKVVTDGSGKHPGDAGFDKSTVKMWGYGTFLGRNTGATPPYWTSMLMEKTGHQDTEPPDWKADSWVSDAGLSIMQFTTDWIKKYQILSPSTLNMALPDGSKFFDQGGCAVYDFGTNVYAAAAAQFQFPKDDISFTLSPTFDGTKWGPIGLNHWSMGVSNKSKALDPALTVIDFWLNPDSDLIMSEVGGQQPKRLSTAKNKFFDAPNESFMKLVTEGLAQWSMPDLSPPVRTNELLTEAYQSIVTQNTPVKTAMQSALDRYNKLLSEIPKSKLPKV